jgi:hypothetical protein
MTTSSSSSSSSLQGDIETKKQEDNNKCEAHCLPFFSKERKTMMSYAFIIILSAKVTNQEEKKNDFFVHYVFNINVLKKM